MFVKDKIKRSIALLAAIVLLYNSIGYIFIYRQLIQLTKDYNHSAIERKEVKEEIILLSFKKSDISERKIDFQWKHNKEFKYNGGMYDIVDRYETKDSVHFYCFYDNKENKLEEEFSRHFEKEKEGKKNNSGRTLLSQLTDQYLIPDYFFYTQATEKIYSFYLVKGNPLNEPEVPSPPPKLNYI